MPDTLTTPTRAGLFTRGDVPVPLRGVTVAADIVSLGVRVTVTQRYVNGESHPIEAVYVFPLEEGAAVCGFEALIDGTLVVGEAMEREAAFAKYDDAMQAGHGAYLLDEERPDVFQASVGNLPPGKEALLKITYVAELDVQNGSLRFVVPTTVAPRYAPAADHRGLGRPDAETLNPPRAWHVPYGLNLAVTVAMPGAIGRIESPSHPISMTVAGSQTTVALAAEEVALDRDFVLAISAHGLDVPHAWIERDGDGPAAVAISYVPTLPASTQPAEVIFVVDESGSMQGASIEQVRNALQLCLRSMVAGCRFNILSFGSDFGSLFTESRAYDEASLSAATAFVHGMTADRGGTEILPALRSVLQQAPSPGLSRQVVVLTDGEVTNTDEVIALARAHAATTRVFTFGIGAGPSRHLVQGLARAGRGSAEFITPGERIEPKVVRLFGRLLAPAVTDVAVQWGGLDAVSAPSAIPPLFSGARLVTYGFVNDLKPATVTLTAKGPGGPLTFELPIDPAAATTGRTIGTLAARARIRELEESEEWTHARASRQGRTRASGVTQEIIDLAVRYSLASRETSLVAIEHRETPVVGNMELRHTPIAVTSGWGGQSLGVPRAAGRRPAAAMVMDGAVERVLDEAAFMRAMPEKAVRERRVPSDIGSFLSGLRPTSWRRHLMSEADHELRARVMRLASLQRADGSWELTRDLAAVVDRPLGHLEADLPEVPGDEAAARRAWATAIAVTWLDLNARSLVDEWGLIADKGVAWLNTVGVTLSGWDYKNLARQCLSGE